MGYPERIDLHMHTTVSDGTDTPEELLHLVKEAGIGIFSITDHDAVKGCCQVAEILAGDDPAFVTGAEFSCKDEEGAYHILGYGYDPEAPSIRSLIDTGHAYRMRKAVQRLEYLEEVHGVIFPEEAVEEFLSMENPGKPHLGNMMARYGYVRTKDEAFRDYLGHLHVKGEYLRPEEAIRGILDGGGVPVLAHPPYGNGDQLIVGEEMERRLKRLMEFGLQGIEGFYSRFSPRLTEEMRRYAECWQLYVTAGSDYHGRNKMIEMGDTGLPSPEEWPEGFYRFLERVGIQP